eukprot:TRINITY_DN4847_c0_g1_i2.p1 TRINITY_DN4847_c0_g1~~TRINITY_DN4847_c0_g1_i2.p1  ORF type:complete len:694 (-),score=58.55 TRINITY_DN4847_c0_g1_i2:114-2165(-)
MPKASPSLYLRERLRQTDDPEAGADHLKRFDDLLVSLRSEYVNMQRRLNAHESLDSRRISSLVSSGVYQDAACDIEDAKFEHDDIPPRDNEREIPDVLERWSYFVSKFSECYDSTTDYQLLRDWQANIEHDQTTEGKIASDEGGVASKFFSGGGRGSDAKALGVGYASTKASEYVMNPFCRKRMVWIVLSTLMLQCDFVILSIEVFTPVQEIVHRFFEWSSMIFWSLDIVLSFFTAVYIKGDLIRNPRIIARQYATTWLPLDLVCTLPDWISLAVGAINKGGISSFMSITRFVRYFRLFRLLKMRRLAGFLVDALNSPMLSFLARPFMYTIALLIWLHTVACLWFLVGSSKPRGWLYVNEANEASPAYQYFVAVHWVAAQLQGNVDTAPGKEVGDRAFAVVVILFSIAIISVLIGELTNLLLEFRVKSQRAQKLSEYLQRHRIPADLAVRVKKHIQLVWKSSPEEPDAEREVLKMLPRKVRRELLFQVRSSSLAGHTVYDFLKESHLLLLERICCDHLRQHYVVANEDIFSAGEVCRMVHVVEDGQVAYWNSTSLMSQFYAQASGQRNPERGLESDSPGIAVCHKHEQLCEAVLWTYWKHHGDLVAYSASCLVVLSAADFHIAVRAFYEASLELRRHAAVFVAHLNECAPSARSDLLSSDSLFKRLSNGGSIVKGLSYFKDLA